MACLERAQHNMLDELLVRPCDWSAGRKEGEKKFDTYPIEPGGRSDNLRISPEPLLLPPSEHPISRHKPSASDSCHSLVIESTEQTLRFLLARTPPMLFGKSIFIHTDLSFTKQSSFSHANDLFKNEKVMQFLNSET